MPSTASEAEVREAGRRLTKRFHPDAPVAPDASHLKREIEVVFIRVAEAYEVLRDTERRTRHERMLGLTPSASPPPPPKPQQPPSDPEVRTTPSGVPAAPASDADSDLRLAAHVLKEARALLAQERNWDAVRKLEDALVLAPGTKVNQALRVLLAQATGKNPKWQKRAEEILLSVIQENANTPDAHLELGVALQARRLEGARGRAVPHGPPAAPLRPAGRGRAGRLELATGRDEDATIAACSGEASAPPVRAAWPGGTFCARAASSSACRRRS